MSGDGLRLVGDLMILIGDLMILYWILRLWWALIRMAVVFARDLVAAIIEEGEPWPMSGEETTPKSCPACRKTTLKVYRHDITPFTDADHPAEPVAWQCVYCGTICSRLGGSGRVVAEGRRRIVLAPGELEGLVSYQTKRNRRP